MDDADFLPTATAAMAVGSLSLSSPPDDPMGTSDGIGHRPSNNEETPTIMAVVDENSIDDS